MRQKSWVKIDERHRLQYGGFDDRRFPGITFSITQIVITFFQNSGFDFPNVRSFSAIFFSSRETTFAISRHIAKSKMQTRFR